MELKLHQKEIAPIFNVTKETIYQWESDIHPISPLHISKIITFLGYNPYPTDLTTLGGRILNYRLVKGLSLRAMGRLLDIHHDEVAQWEGNEKKPLRKHIQRIERLLNEI